ncbi:MAG: Lrp/AsnC family transcriptional regulator [Candidatus Odinarchaeia archaeon]
MTVVFMLIEVESGKIHDVLKKLKTIEGVEERYSITGPYDLIAKVSAKDMETIKNILQQIQEIEGVIKTLSSIVLPF